MAGDSQERRDGEINAAVELQRPRLLALLFADWGAITSDGKVVLAGIFDKIFIRPAEGQLKAFFIYLRAVQVHGNAVQIQVFSPSGEDIGGLTTGFTPEFIPSPDEPNFLQIVTGISLELASPGVYWFDVSYGEQTLGRVPLLASFPENTDGPSDTT